MPSLEVRRRLRLLGRDRGEITSVLILMLAVMQIVFLIIHASLVFHGRQVASAAAQEALHEAQLFEGDTAAGTAAGNEVLALTNVFTSSNVNVSRGDDTVTVTVTATVDTLLFPVANNVTVKVSGPAERYLSESQRT